jgi:putative transposase
VSRKTKGSRNREKARRRLGRLSARVGDRRRDALHQITTEIVRENQVVVIEDLPVKQMQASGGAHKRGLNRSIADAGWGELRRMLEYKCGWYGRRLVVVDRWFPSSKTCSACGHVLDELPLDVRAWTCPGCGVAHDRDVNAATNVLAAGLAVLACGHGVSPLHTGGGRG